MTATVVKRGRMMGVGLTIDAVVDQTKTVTRRLGWAFLRPGDRLQLCRKAMGLRKGERAEVLAVVEVLSCRAEPLRAITAAEVALEGVGPMTPAEFVAFFAAGNRGATASTIVNRIEFRYLTAGAGR